MTVSRSPTPATAGRRTATFLLRQPRLAQGFREPLPAQAGAPAEGEQALTLLWIPPGRFWMGPAPGELPISNEEGPRQLMDVQGFFLAQTPITQAQWRAVATWDPPVGKEWERELTPSPSFFLSRQRLEATATLLRWRVSSLPAGAIDRSAPGGQRGLE
jgi:formylglycine-generating enzyme required for sulfatase activity